MRIEFDKNKFEYKGYVRGGSYTYDKNAEYFRAYGINLPESRKAHYASHDLDDTYRIHVDGPVNFFKASVITLAHYAYQDNDFCTWSENALHALSHIPHTERKELATIEKDFQALQFKKNQELIEIQNQLKKVAETLALDYPFVQFPLLESSDSPEQLFKQNLQLIEENNKLYKEIIEKARREAERYNDSALKAIILSLSMDYVRRQEPVVIEEAQKAYEEHLNPKEELDNSQNSIPLIASVQLPEPGKIYPFLEPKKEFPHLDEIYYSSNSFYKDNRATIKKENVAELENKVNRLFDNHKKCHKDQKGWFTFLVTLKNVFSAIYNGFIEVLSGAKQSANPVEKHSDLAENVENITNGTEVSKTARLIHQFNSRPSPLVHVIYDKELANEEKEDLLVKLAQAKPYRFKHETPETRKNIDIPAQSIGEGSGHYSPEGSPLHHAVEHGTTSMVRILLESGANPNTIGMCIGIKHVDCKGVTPLHMAVAQGNVEKVKVLLQYGADINATNEAGQTPLHAVTDVEIFNLLIQKGAKINVQDGNKQTPLHFAVKRGQQELVQAFLANDNLQVDLQDKAGNTPLHLAAATSFEASERSYPHYSFSSSENKEKKAQNLQMMSALIKKGANVNQANVRGYTPLHMAVLDGQGTVGYNWVQNNIKHLDYQHIQQQVQLLCDNGADVRRVSETYEEPKSAFSSGSGRKYHPAPMTTPLQALYSHKSSETRTDKKVTSARLSVAKYLIERGADCHLTYQQSGSTNGIYQEKGNTLLHQCARFADSEAFAYFRSLGLDPNYQASSQHNTPFHEFMYWHSTYAWSSTNSRECLQVFFENGVDVNKTKDERIQIDLNALQKGMGLSLRDSTIAAIFNHDNKISRKAKEMGLVVDDKNGREILKKVYQAILDNEHKGHHVPLEITAPLTGLEYAYTGSQSVPSSEAVEMVKKQSEQAPLTQGLTCN